MKDTHLEVEVPPITRWGKHVTNVRVQAENGWDWLGTWLPHEGLVVLPTGALVAACTQIYSDCPEDRVTLWVLTPLRS